MKESLDHRRMLTLCRDGITDREVAAELGCSLWTVFKARSDPNANLSRRFSERLRVICEGK